jgi:hypothetical protein
VYWDDMKEGMHRISGYTDAGGSIYRDFPVRISPEHSFIPNATVKWLGDENPWKANMTIADPIIITETVEVVRTVTIPVTPSNEQLQEAERVVKAEQDKRFWASVGNATMVVIGVGVLILVGRYGLSIYRRLKK